MKRKKKETVGSSFSRGERVFPTHPPAASSTASTRIVRAASLPIPSFLEQVGGRALLWYDIVSGISAGRWKEPERQLLRVGAIVVQAAQQSSPKVVPVLFFRAWVNNAQHPTLPLSVIGSDSSRVPTDGGETCLSSIEG